MKALSTNCLQRTKKIRHLELTTTTAMASPRGASVGGRLSSRLSRNTSSARPTGTHHTAPHTAFANGPHDWCCFQNSEKFELGNLQWQMHPPWPNRFRQFLHRLIAMVVQIQEIHYRIRDRTSVCTQLPKQRELSFRCRERGGGM